MVDRNVEIVSGAGDGEVLVDDGTGTDDLHEEIDTNADAQVADPTGDRHASLGAQNADVLSDSETDVQVECAMARAADRRRFTRAVSIGGALAFVPFLALLWDFGFAPLRTAVPGGIFSDFYDLQARAFMEGRVDVPKGSLAFEAFVVDGRDYIYFPPFPSLIRIPFLWLGGDGLDGRLTAPAILVAWLVTTVLISLLLWRVRTIVRPDASLGRLEVWCYGAFVLASCGGSILVFVASLPWVYHEAYAWGVAGAIGTVFCLIGLIERPSWQRSLTTGIWATIAVLSRTTSGWAVAFAILLCAAWFLFGRRGTEARRVWWAVALAGVVPLLIGGSFNFAKFRHPWLFPLDQQVWTQINQHRRDALAANGGSLVGPQFFPTSLISYLRPDGIRFTSMFPFVTLPANPARGFNGAFIDQTYRTGSVTAFMPGLFLLSVWGLWVSFRRGAQERLRWLRIPILGALGITGGVMFFGSLTHRYTAEFFPVLVVAGSVGAVHLAGRVDDATARVQRGVMVVVSLVLMFSVVANVATSIHAAHTIGGGSSLRDYVSVQHRLSQMMGGPLDGYVDRGDDLPNDGPTDHLRIVGDCEALYLASGDHYEPWIPVEVQDVALEITPIEVGDNEAVESGDDHLVLLTFDGIEDQDLILERLANSRFRLVIGTGPNRLVGPSFPASEGVSFRVFVRADTARKVYRLEGPLTWSTDVPMTSHGPDWVWQPKLLRIPGVSGPGAERLRVAVDVLPAPVPDICRGLEDETS